MVNNQRIAHFIVAFIAHSEAVSTQEAAQCHVILAIKLHVDDAWLIANVWEYWRGLALTIKQDG
jgi:hypothetical protein